MLLALCNRNPLRIDLERKVICVFINELAILCLSRVVLLALWSHKHQALSIYLAVHTQISFLSDFSIVASLLPVVIWALPIHQA